MNKIWRAKTAICIFLDAVLLLAGMAYVFLISSRVIAPGGFMTDMSVLPMVMLTALFVLVLVDAVAAFAVSTSTWHSTFLAVSLLLYYFFSEDMTVSLYNVRLYPNAALFESLHYAFFLLSVIALFVLWNYTYRLHIPARQAIAACAFAAACAVAYGVCVMFRVQSVVAFLSLAVVLPLFIRTYVSVCRAKKDNFNFYVTGFILCSVCGLSLAEIVCNTSLVSAFPAGASTACAFAGILCYAVIYIYFIAGLDTRALKASQYKLQYERVKSQALRAQIKPHFVFNVLSSVKSLYRRDRESGDLAINLFSRHLRANIEALNIDFVPFEKELDNIQVFVSLENLRREKPFKVIFDIDCTDFDIPVLSLQPYVENAIKYSKVNEKEDGYIRISSSEADGKVLLEISDNGVGFDLGAIRPSSCGIKNSRERFLLLIGTEPEIRSVPGRGTEVIIRLGKNAKEDFQNENDHRR